jgi:hypothetical protein
MISLVPGKKKYGIWLRGC